MSNSRIGLLSIVAVLWLMGTPAGADGIARTAPPVFSSAESETIARNASLSRAVGVDPWAVRNFLDALAEADAEGITEAAPAAQQSEEDPDFKRLERSSPEAAHDLLLIIKQAASDQGATARNTGAPGK